MFSILDPLLNCFGFRPQENYQELRKKDDDVRDKVIDWIESNPIKTNMHQLSDIDMKHQIKAIFERLSKMEIHESNVQCLSLYFYEGAKQSQRFHEECSDRIDKLSCKKNIKLYLKASLITLTPHHR